jgi:hypothetical protein
VVCTAAICLSGGCSAWTAPQRDDPSTVSIDDILQRCGETYRSLTTLQAGGWLRDFRRQTSPRIAPISWQFARPDRCRLQIGMDTAIVSGQDWWTYEAKTGQYKKHRQFTRTPIETASYLISQDVPFLLPVLLSKGASALRSGHAEPWRFQGVGWYAGAPCHVLVRGGQDGQTEPGTTIQRLWIDQDRFLLRGWMISVPGREGRERPLIECAYADLSVDEPLPTDWLQLKAPTPITPTAKGESAS